MIVLHHELVVEDLILQKRNDYRTKGGGVCIFTAIVYYRLRPISARSERVKDTLKSVKKHQEEEENLKRYLREPQSPKV